MKYVKGIAVLLIGIFLIMKISEWTKGRAPIGLMTLALLVVFIWSAYKFEEQDKKSRAIS